MRKQMEEDRKSAASAVGLSLGGGPPKAWREPIQSTGHIFVDAPKKSAIVCFLFASLCHYKQLILGDALLQTCCSWRFLASDIISTCQETSEAPGQAGGHDETMKRIGRETWGKSLVEMIQDEKTLGFGW